MSRITQIVARQVGTLQGAIVSQVQENILDILSKFNNQCPSQEEMVKIVRRKNNLLLAINSFERRVNQLGGIGRQLQPAISTARTGINIIKRIPRPTVFKIIPPNSGGIVRGVSFSALTSLSDRLIQLDKLLTSLQADVAGVRTTVDSIRPTLINLKSRLTSIDTAIQECNTETSNNGVTELSQDLKNQTQETAEGLLDSRYEYKGFKLEVVEDLNSPSVAPRRFAIAKDRRGIVVLKGQPSFSSSIDVLLDEIKFRIDNRLS